MANFRKRLIVAFVAAIAALLKSSGLHAQDIQVVEAEITSAAGWVIEPHGKDQWTFSASATVNCAGLLRWELADAGGRLLQSIQQPINLSSTGSSNNSVQMDLSSLSVGEYLARARIVRDGKTVGGCQHSLVIAGPDDAFILFDRTPLEHGLSFDRSNFCPLEITDDGLKQWVWAFRPDASTASPRLLQMNFTDKRFRSDAMRVMDVTLAVRPAMNKSMHLVARTKAGDQGLGLAKGPNGPADLKDLPFKILRGQLNDGLLVPSTMPARGKADLRLESSANEGSARAIFIHPYDRTVNPDWKRLLVVKPFEADRPRFLWSPGEAATVSLHLSNLALVPFDHDVIATLTDDQEKPIWTKRIHINVPATDDAAAPVTVDTAGFRQGVYFLNFATVQAADGLDCRALLTIADTAPLPKAKDDEFWYGADIAATYDNTVRLDWVDWLGLDVVRGFARDVVKKGDDLDDISRAVDALSARGLRGQFMVDPLMPFDPDPTRFDKIVAQRAAFVGKVAAKFKGRIKWYELGNEPDQFYFFNGGAANYIKIYLAMRDAIKAADPDAIVSNGGLCFHDNYGEKVGHDIVRLMPADKIDAWAYHAHGPGSGAERHIFDTITQATKLAGSDNKPFIDTESGYFCDEPVGYRIQARTVVQKMIFAESSKRVKMFLWFGLHPGWGFGLLETPSQARPGALACRVMVQRTRGLSPQGALDIYGAPGEAYSFTNSSGQATVVLWSNGAEFTRNIALGAGERNAKIYDLFGNASPAIEDDNGRVQVSVGADPIYLSATLKPGMRPTILPPAIDVPTVIRVIPGSNMLLSAVVHNPSTQPLDADVIVTPQGNVLASASRVPVHLLPNTTSNVSLPLQVAAISADWWPKIWSVFQPINGDVDLAAIQSLPDSLSSVGTKLTPLIGITVNNKLDLRKLTGGFAEKREAICFATVDLPVEGDVQIGASADFWMEWWVNGKRVFSTLDVGNGSVDTVLAHVFTAHMKKGRNLLAVRVLSGSSTWTLTSGGPQIVASAQRQKEGNTDGAVVELRSGNQVFARELVRFDLLPPVRPTTGEDWSQYPPDAVLGEVENFFIKAPDPARWYKGPSDLSGQIWLAQDGVAALHIRAAIRDDIAMPGDGIRVRLAWGDNWKTRLDIVSKSPYIAVRRDDSKGVTYYDVAIPAKDFPIAPRQLFALQVTVTDDDWGEPKQQASIASGDDPNSWFQTWFDAKEN